MSKRQVIEVPLGSDSKGQTLKNRHDNSIEFRSDEIALWHSSDSRSNDPIILLKRKYDFSLTVNSRDFFIDQRLSFESDEESSFYDSHIIREILGNEHDNQEPWNIPLDSENPYLSAKCIGQFNRSTRVTEIEILESKSTNGVIAEYNSIPINIYTHDLGTGTGRLLFDEFSEEYEPETEKVLSLSLVVKSKSLEEFEGILKRSGSAQINCQADFWVESEPDWMRFGAKSTFIIKSQPVSKCSIKSITTNIPAHIALHFEEDRIDRIKKGMLKRICEDSLIDYQFTVSDHSSKWDYISERDEEDEGEDESDDVQKNKPRKIENDKLMEEILDTSRLSVEVERIINEAFDSVGASISEADDEYDYKLRRIEYEVRESISAFREAVNQSYCDSRGYSYKGSIPYRLKLWSQRDIVDLFKRGSDSSDAFSEDFGRNDIESLGAEYLSRVWRSCYFERIVCEACITTEAWQFSNTIKESISALSKNEGFDLSISHILSDLSDYSIARKTNYNLNKMYWEILKRNLSVGFSWFLVLCVIPLVGAYFLIDEGLEIWGIGLGAIGLLYLLIKILRFAISFITSVVKSTSGIPKPENQFQKYTKLIDRMAYTSRQMSSGFADPRRILEIVNKDSEEGIGYPSVLEPILQRAIDKGDDYRWGRNP